MTTDTSTEIIEQNGMLIGPYRRPRNLESKDPSSIHNDETARKLGFRGGTIAGSFHMEQFPPLLLRAFGERWFEHGNLSCYFRNATLDNESVADSCITPAAPDSVAVDRARARARRHSTSGELAPTLLPEQ
jgi:hypothetical protein